LIYALSTLLSQFYYGDKSLNYLSRKKSYHRLYLLVFILVCILSPLLSADTVWKISDLNIALLTVFNLTILNFLFKTLKKEEL